MCFRNLLHMFQVPAAKSHGKQWFIEFTHIDKIACPDFLHVRKHSKGWAKGVGQGRRERCVCVYFRE